MPLFTPTYLPEDAEEKLRQYEYHGQDHSYLYQHFWRPLCRSVVNYLPVWLAANVITVGALLFVCVSHVLLSLSMPSFSVKTSHQWIDDGDGEDTLYSTYLPPPRYVLLLAALALFLYQLLDNLDGHQARRTGTSSPLGLLMDHGCDAFNCIVGALNLAAAIASGPCWKVWLILTNTVVVFFLNTWEEYYRGVLVLPVINGPNEGILMAIALYVWTAVKGGPQWWNNAVEIPARWLPAVLRQSAPQAAADFEAAVLRRVCPLLLARPAAPRRHGPPDPEYSVLPFLLNMNCSESYVRGPPLPTRKTRVDFLADPKPDISKLWKGNSPIQQMVLRLYGTSEDVLHIKYNTIMVWFITALAVCTCAGHIYQVYRAIRASHKPQLGSGWLYRRFPFFHALTRLLPLFLLTVLSCIWFLTSQEDIFRRHPRIFCWTVGLLYTKLAVHLMVSHLCDDLFHPFRRTFVPYILFGLHIFLTYVINVNRLRRSQLQTKRSGSASGSSGGGDRRLPNGSIAAVGGGDGVGGSTSPSSSGEYYFSQYAYYLDEELILYEFFALSVVTFIHLVYKVVRETANVLHVPIFTVPVEKQKTLRAQIQAEQTQKKKERLTKKKKA